MNIKTLCKGHYSFFVVLEVHLEQCVIVKDIFLEKQYSVTEKQGTRYLKRGDIVFSQIVTFNNQSLFIGMAHYMVPAHYHHSLMALLDQWIEKNGALNQTLLREDTSALIESFFYLLKATCKPPEARNTDNEPLQFCKSHFKISIATEEALRQLLPLTLSDIEDCLQGSKRDPSGKVIQVTFDWLKVGNKKHKLWNNTVMGHISITSNKLILEINSENRDQKGVALILKYLGEHVGEHKNAAGQFKTCYALLQDPELCFLES